jgi:peptide/nickel transport system permease protein
MIGLLLTVVLAARASHWARRRKHPQRWLWCIWGMGLLGAMGGALMAQETQLAKEGLSVSLPYVAASLAGIFVTGSCYLVMRFWTSSTSGKADVIDTVESFWGLVWKRFRKHRLALGAAVILLILIDVSLLAQLLEWLLSVSHEQTSLKNRYLGAGWPHLLGTDDLGRDVFTRLIFGGQISLAVGMISALSSASIGTCIGLLAGYYGGWIDSLLMRFTDAMLSIPVLPLMIVFSALDLNILFQGGEGLTAPLLFCACLGICVYLARVFMPSHSPRRRSSLMDLRLYADGLAVFGVTFGLYLFVFRFINWESIGGGNLGSVVKIILIIVFFGWMTVARLARAAALQLKNLEFVTAARALGGSDRRILLVHILPNALAPIIVAATLEVGGNILYEAALSFLGLGVQPPVPSWGNMLNNALDYIKRDPLLAFWPGLLILVTVSCFNFFGDGMRDALDPHQVMKGK